MTTKQKPPHDLIKAAQEMAAHFRGKLTLTKRKVMPSGDDDAVQVSTVKRWLNKPGFQTAFEKEYKEFLVSEEAARNGIHNTDKASEVPHKS